MIGPGAQVLLDSFGNGVPVAPSDQRIDESIAAAVAEVGIVEAEST